MFIIFDYILKTPLQIDKQRERQNENKAGGMDYAFRFAAYGLSPHPLYRGKHHPCAVKRGKRYQIEYRKVYPDKRRDVQ